ncbi:MAG: TrkA C-terminal domain-containing protein [Pleurocapsa sp.]
MTEIEVDEDNWLANKKLKELRLTDEGIAVLGIERQDRIYIGAPYGDTCIYPGDILIVYGRKTALLELDVRLGGIEGEDAHQKAVAIHQKIQQKQNNYGERAVKQK